MPGLSTVVQWLCLALVTVTSVETMARPPERGDRDRDNPRGISVGAAVVGGQALYEGVDRPDALAVPFLGYESRRFYLRGLRAGLRAWSTDRLSADFILQPRLDQLDPDDSDALDGMALRRRSLDGGVAAAWRHGGWSASANLLTDLLGRHEGQEASLGFGYRFGPPFLFIRPALAVEWQSPELTRYYYGVRDSEARPGRPAYQPGAAVNIAAAVAGRYSFGRHWGLFLSARHTWLDPAISDSPIVERSRRWSGIAALTYTFR